MTDLFDTPASKAATFDDFWGKTPKTGSKHQSRRKFQSLSPANRTAATEAVQGYYAWWGKANPQASTLHVSTYLNQRRWEDDDWQQGKTTQALTKEQRMQVDVDRIKSGRSFLCKAITATQARYLMNAGLVTKSELDAAQVIY